jgi:hypothetical protein
VSACTGCDLLAGKRHQRLLMVCTFQGRRQGSPSSRLRAHLCAHHRRARCSATNSLTHLDDGRSTCIPQTHGWIRLRELVACRGTGMLTRTVKHEEHAALLSAPGLPLRTREFFSEAPCRRLSGRSHRIDLRNTASRAAKRWVLLFITATCCARTRRCGFAYFELSNSMSALLGTRICRPRRKHGSPSAPFVDSNRRASSYAALRPILKIRAASSTV